MDEMQKFFDKFRDFLLQSRLSKERGNNDYNPLKAVQKIHSEENMHSGFLFSMLDINGEHYQNDLFLIKFLEAVNLKEWFGESKNAVVEKEVKKGTNRFDLWIYNADKHIIIENKIYAQDQDGQIARYIDEIKDDVKCENIAIIYLTLEGKKPSENSLGEWKISENSEFLERENERIIYRQISYKSKILSWIDKCQSEVGNITNLNQAFEFYKDIVKIITEQKENKMSVVNFFRENFKESDFEMLDEIYRHKSEIAGIYLENVLCEVLEKEFDSCGLSVEYGKDYGGISIEPKDIKSELFFYFWVDGDKLSVSIQFHFKNEGEQECTKEEKQKLESVVNNDKIDYDTENFFIQLKKPMIDKKFTDFPTLKSDVINFIKENLEFFNEINEKIAKA